jgi:hypothetical protein
MCEKVGPEEAAQFKRELKRFLTAYPELMQRLEQSPYFEKTKRGFSQWVKERTELESKNELANDCIGCYNLLESFTDYKNTPEGVDADSEWLEILRH